MQSMALPMSTGTYSCSTTDAAAVTNATTRSGRCGPT